MTQPVRIRLAELRRAARVAKDESVRVIVRQDGAFEIDPRQPPDHPEADRARQRKNPQSDDYVL